MPRDVLLLLAGAIAAVVLEHAGGWLWASAIREEDRQARAWARRHPELLTRANDLRRREPLDPPVLPFRRPSSRRAR